MEKVFDYLNEFFSGLAGVLMTVLPLTILWEVLTGGLLFNMDVITNLTSLVNGFGTGGFAGLVVLVLVSWFFVRD
jgi:C4-dicarboxylate transporter